VLDLERSLDTNKVPIEIEVMREEKRRRERNRLLLCLRKRTNEK
jgi:hypothetical protein